MNIPTKHLKQTVDIICEHLMNIWNEEIIQNKIFSTKLKLADICPVFKRLEFFLFVTKIFERIMQKQVNGFVERHLSPYLCGYRKGYSS